MPCKDIQLDIHRSFWISMNHIWIFINLFEYPRITKDIQLDIQKNKNKDVQTPEFKKSIPILDIFFLYDSDVIQLIQSYPTKSRVQDKMSWPWSALDTIVIHGFNGYPKECPLDFMDYFESVWISKEYRSFFYRLSRNNGAELFFCGLVFKIVEEEKWKRRSVSHTRELYNQRVKRQEFCFGDSGVRLGVMGRAVMVDVPEATIRMGIAVDSKLEWSSKGP